MLDPRIRYWDVVGFSLESDEPGTLLYCGGACAAAAGERIEHDAASWRQESNQPAHEFDRLDGGMDVGDWLDFCPAGWPGPAQGPRRGARRTCLK